MKRYTIDSDKIDITKIDFNTFDDDDLFVIKHLLMPVHGRTLKSPEGRARLATRIREEQNRIDYESRCYPDRYKVQVYRNSLDPLTYLIYPAFGDIKPIVQQLGLPEQPMNTYFSITTNVGRLIKGRMIKKSIVEYFKKLQNYTVEDFGLLIEPTIESGPGPDQPRILKYPNPSKYKCPPRCWEMRGSALLYQVWRTRIFPFPQDSIQTDISKPLTLNSPDKIYFEQRWHPRYGNHWLIGGLENKDKFKGVDIDDFYHDALRILGYVKKLPGPKEIEDSEQFEQDLKDAYLKLCANAKRRPSRSAVADELLMDRRTLSKYISRFGISWPPKL